MNEQNIMENNEVLEVAEEIAKTNFGLGWKIGIGVLITAGVTLARVKLRNKFKTKKEEAEVIEITEDDVVEVESVEVEEKKTKKNK